MGPIRILGLAGSARQGSHNVRLLHAAIANLREMGIETDTFDFREHPLPLFSIDVEEQGMPENAVMLRNKIALADGVLIVAPEYNASITPLLKNAIDWCSRTDPANGQTNVWDKKVVGLASASPGLFGGVRGLYSTRQPLLEVNALVLSEQVSVGRAHEAIDENGHLKDERTAKFLRAMLERLVFVSGRLRG